MIKNIVKYVDTKSISDMETLLEKFNLNKYSDIKKFFKDNNFSIIETEKKMDEPIGYTIGNGDVTFFVKKEKYSNELIEIFNIFNRDKSWGIAPFVPYLYYSASLGSKKNQYYCFYETFSLNLAELLVMSNYEARTISEVIITVLIALLYFYDQKILHNDLHVKNVMINIGDDVRIRNIYVHDNDVFTVMSKYRDIVVNDFGLSCSTKQNIVEIKKIYDAFLARFYYIELLKVSHDESIYERIFFIDLWRFLSSVLSQIKNNMNDDLMSMLLLFNKYVEISTQILLYKNMYDYKSVVISLIYEMIFIHEAYSVYDNISKTNTYKIP